MPVLARSFNEFVPSPTKILPTVNVPTPVPPSTTLIVLAKAEIIPPVKFARIVAVLDAVTEPAARTFDVGSEVKPLNKKKSPPALRIRP